MSSAKAVEVISKMSQTAKACCVCSTSLKNCNLLIQKKKKKKKKRKERQTFFFHYQEKLSDRLLTLRELVRVG